MAAPVHSSAPAPVPANPFPGLRPFDVEESDLFFGREREVRELLGRLRRTRFLAVVGASGCGKSSLIRAGLLAALRDGYLVEGGAGWRIAILRPGDAPISRLAEALDRPEALGGLHPHPEELGAVLATLQRGALGLVETAAEAPLPMGERLLVLVDQFEELFRFATSAERGLEEARAFAKLLVAAVSQRKVPIYVVLTMRSEFLGACAPLPGLPEAINQGLYLVPQMSREALREVIKGPVERAGAKVTERLVNRLLNDLADDPDPLPILQHALMRIWDDAGTGGEPLDLPLYNKIGRLSEALTLHLEEVYGDLAGQPGMQGIAERLFRALTETLEEGQVVRRPTRFGRIIRAAGAEPAAVAAVVDRFRAPGRSFLIPPAGVPLEPRTVLDISHESLIRRWPRLAGWAATEAGATRVASDLAMSARRWQESGGEPSYLFHGKRLAAAEEWDQANPGELGPVEQDFLKASIRLRREQKLRRQEQELPRVMVEQAASLQRSIEKGTAQVFLAASHKDAHLAARLAERLREAGQEVWLAEERLVPEALAVETIQGAIEQADAVICLLSPDFILSDFARMEIDFALQKGKRLIPVLARTVAPGSVHPALAELQWGDLRKGTEAPGALDFLLEALDADIEWVQMHTRLLVRAAEWQKRSQDGSLLLRGKDLAAAERLLAHGSRQRRPAVTTDQAEYILASRRLATRRQRAVFAVVVAALLAMLLLSAFAILQRQRAMLALKTTQEARTQAEKARKQAEEALRQTQAARALAERNLALALSSWGQRVVSRPATRPADLQQTLAANQEIQKGIDKETDQATLARRQKVHLYYYPNDLSDQTEGPRLEAALRGLGFTLEQGAKMGRTPINAIWFGRDIDVEDIRVIAYALIRAGVEIKHIACIQSRYPGRESDVQVGGSPASADSPPLTVDQVRQQSGIKACPASP